MIPKKQQRMFQECRITSLVQDPPAKTGGESYNFLRTCSARRTSLHEKAFEKFSPDFPQLDKPLSPNSPSRQFPRFGYSLDEVTSLGISSFSFWPCSCAGRDGEQWFPSHCLCHLPWNACLTSPLLSLPWPRHCALSHHTADRICFPLFNFPFTPSS